MIPEKSGRLQVKLGNQNENLQIVGTTPNFQPVNRYELAAGRMFTLADNAAKRRLAVVGNDVAGKFDTTAEGLLGETIYMNSVAFEVVGVMESVGQVGWRNVDEQIWIPLDTARFRVFGNDELDRISAQVGPGYSPEEAIIDLERVLRREHKILPGKNNDFDIGDPTQFFNVRKAATDIFAYLLAGIATISLVVGGIGIMNIMLVTVTERTREVGIRKALGATRMNILMQFLVEALVLCLLGGGVGILLGSGISMAIAKICRLADHRVARRHRRCVRLQRRRRPVLRHLAGAQGREPESHRRVALRVAGPGVTGKRVADPQARRARVRVRGFAPVVGRAPRLLILGSMPSEASLVAGEYYGLPRNAFWPIMGRLFGAGRELAYADRLTVLKRAGIALWDVLAECQRPGSLDSAIDLKSARTNDLVNFYQRHRSIRRVFFNGSKAAEIYRRRILPDAQIVAPYLSHARLPSTSPAMASLSLEEKIAAWQVLADDSRSKA